LADVPFTKTESGKHSGLLTKVEGALNPGDRVAIDGSLDLSPWIVGHGGACVFSIEMMYQSKVGGNYVINIVAQGPAGFFSGSLGLTFSTRTEPTLEQFQSEGDSALGEFWNYDIYSSTKKQHSKPFHTDRPSIETIRWFHRTWPVIPGLSG
jgi:hypothetical protein